jgi:hypothetical protein
MYKIGRNKQNDVFHELDGVSTILRKTGVIITPVCRIIVETPDNS